MAHSSVGKSQSSSVWSLSAVNSLAMNGQYTQAPMLGEHRALRPVRSVCITASTYKFDQFLHTHCLLFFDMPFTSHHACFLYQSMRTVSTKGHSASRC